MGAEGKDWHKEVQSYENKQQNVRDAFYQKRAALKLSANPDGVLNDLQKSGYKTLENLQGLSEYKKTVPAFPSSLRGKSQEEKNEYFDKNPGVLNTLFKILKDYFAVAAGCDSAKAEKEAYLSLHFLSTGQSKIGKTNINVDFLEGEDELAITDGKLTITDKSGNTRVAEAFLRPATGTVLKVDEIPAGEIVKERSRRERGKILDDEGEEIVLSPRREDSEEEKSEEDRPTKIPPTGEPEKNVREGEEMEVEETAKPKEPEKPKREPEPKTLNEHIQKRMRNDAEWAKKFNDETTKDQAVYNIIPLYLWGGEKERERSRSFIKEWLKKREGKIDPLTKIDFQNNLADSYLAHREYDGGEFNREQRASDYDAKKALAFAESNLKILRSKALENVDPKIRDAKLSYANYLKAHCVWFSQEDPRKVPQPPEVHRAYEDAINFDIQTGFPSPKTSVYTVTEYANLLMQEGKSSELLELKARVLQWARGDLSINLRNVFQDIFTRLATRFADEGKYEEATRFASETDPSYAPDLYTKLEQQEWKTLSIDQRSAKLLRFLNDDVLEDLRPAFQAKYQELYTQLMEGTRTPLDFYPSDLRVNKAFWKEISALLQTDPEKKKKKLLEALDLIKDSYFTALDDFKRRVQKEYADTVNGEFARSWNVIRGFERGEKITVPEKDEPIEVDREYFILDIPRGFAMEKYVNMERKEGVTVPTGPSDLKIKERGRIFQVYLQRYSGLLEIKTENGPRALKENGKFLFWDPFSEIVRGVPTAYIMHRRLGFAIPPNWSAEIARWEGYDNKLEAMDIPKAEIILKFGDQAITRIYMPRDGRFYVNGIGEFSVSEFDKKIREFCEKNSQ